MWFLVLFESLRASRTSKKILNSDFDSLEMRFNIKEKKKIWWEWKNRLIDRKQRKEFLFLLYWVYDCWSIEWVSIIFLNLFRFISKEIAFSFNKKCVCWGIREIFNYFYCLLACKFWSSSLFTFFIIFWCSTKKYSIINNGSKCFEFKIANSDTTTTLYLPLYTHFLLLTNHSITSNKNSHCVNESSTTTWFFFANMSIFFILIWDSHVVNDCSSVDRILKHYWHSEFYSHIGSTKKYT